jgi:predicted amidohydrolase YtcJ
MAIHNGKIVELGSDRQILNKYKGTYVDAAGKSVYPSFFDAHGHLFWQAEKNLTCDLTGSESVGEVINRIEKYRTKRNPKVLIGRGWDQSLWANKELPNNKELNQVFDDIPVLLYRIDEHAIWVNQKAIEVAQIPVGIAVEGGEIIYDSIGGFTGVFLDNAITLFSNLTGQTSDEELKKSILEIQDQLLEFGITDVHEAGITLKQLEILKSLEKSRKLKISVYAMLFPGQKEMELLKRKGHYKSEKISVRSLKVIGDGALGSRGACLLEPYHDRPDAHGFMLSSIDSIRKVAQFALDNDLQLNVHCIGDSTNRLVLEMMAKMTSQKVDHRWRIEHAQVVNPKDLEFFNGTGIIPSVQPTHAISDMRFVKDRLGDQREKHAYVYKSLFEKANLLAIGTDFPVESFNPFLTFQAAVNRQDANGNPKSGYQVDEAIDPIVCLKGMTIWAALASFQESTKGSLEPNKDANFIIVEADLLKNKNYPENFVLATYIKGKKAFGLGE